MLILSRKKQESVVVGASERFQHMLKVTVLQIRGDSVRLGFRGRCHCSRASPGGVGTYLRRRPARQPVRRPRRAGRVVMPCSGRPLVIRWKSGRSLCVLVVEIARQY